MAPKRRKKPGPAAARPRERDIIEPPPGAEEDTRTVAERNLSASTSPSSLDVERKPSAARTGREELEERFRHHTRAGPDVSAGDIDADWQSASMVGDEAPGGDNPTPGQQDVDDIGKAVGLRYESNEELKGTDKIGDRDKRRWELDPASSEDYQDRNRGD